MNWLSSLIWIVSYIPLYTVFIIYIFLCKFYHIQECRKHLIKDNVGKLIQTFQKYRTGWFVHIRMWGHCDRNYVNYWWDDTKLPLNLVTLTSVMQLQLQHAVPEVTCFSLSFLGWGGGGGAGGGSFGVLELLLLLKAQETGCTSTP